MVDRGRLSLGFLGAHPALVVVVTGHFIVLAITMYAIENARSIPRSRRRCADQA
jgi:hypothetical protein